MFRPGFDQSCYVFIFSYLVSVSLLSVIMPYIGKSPEDPADREQYHVSKRNQKVESLPNQYSLRSIFEIYGRETSTVQYI